MNTSAWGYVGSVLHTSSPWGHAPSVEQSPSPCSTFSAPAMSFPDMSLITISAKSILLSCWELLTVKSMQTLL